MKPISLTIKGINSFIDEQKIDFDRLISNGLFGIFGPTGSGKSTVLDGITLALYGKVARNSSNYINTNVDVASVKYEFEIRESRVRHYVVEREFKRNKEKGINNTFAKLTEVEGVSNCADNNVQNNSMKTILADKVKSVNEKCMEILGLSCEDFTRTVVLPQGKFSEFLKLEGRPRRDMLERIFDLKRYGDDFSVKLSKNIKEQEVKNNQIDGNLVVYKSLTKENIDAQKLEKLTKEEELNSKKLELENLKKEYEAKKNIWELQRELNQYLVIKKDLEQQKNIMEEAKQKVSRAKEALTLKSDIDYLNKSNNKIIEAKNILLGNKAKLEKLRVEEKEILSNFEVAAYDKKNVYPELLVKKSKIDDAIVKEKEVQELEKQVKDLRTEYANKSIQYKVCNNKLLMSNKEIQTLDEKIKSHDSKLANIKVIFNIKDSVINGINLQEKSDEISKKINKLNDSIGILNKEIDSQGQGLDNIKASIQLKLSELNYCEENEQKVKKNIEICENNIRVQERENIAEVLRKQLVVGEPCPVCGIIHEEHGIGKLEHVNKGLKDVTNDYNKQLKDLKLELESIAILMKDKNKGIGDLKIKEGSIASSTIEKQKALKEYINDVKINSQEKETIEIQIKTIKSKIGVSNLRVKYDEIKSMEKIAIELEQTTLQMRERLAELQDIKAQNENEIKLQLEDLTKIKTQGSEKSDVLKDSESKLYMLKEGRDSLNEYSIELSNKINKIDYSYTKCEMQKNQILEDIKECEKNVAILDSSIRELNIVICDTQEKINVQLAKTQFKNIQEVVEAYLIQSEIETIMVSTENYDKQVKKIETNIDVIKVKLKDNVIEEEEWLAIQNSLRQCDIDLQAVNKSVVLANKKLQDMESDFSKKVYLQMQKKEIEHKLSVLKDIDDLFRGKKFVEYVASQQLMYISKIAGKTLGEITSGGYGLELDYDTSKFVIVDNKNGGARRDASTLSGGETFLASLALALALSSQIQLKGTAPLELFFLDEGFGTLDNDLLSTVMGALTQIQKNNLSVGIISHVDEIKDRVPIKLIIEPAESGKGGSKVKIENS